ncbi:Hypothetical predicted protein, partial [Pelobates cultripes]
NEDKLAREHLRTKELYERKFSNQSDLVMATSLVCLTFGSQISISVIKTNIGGLVTKTISDSIIRYYKHDFVIDLCE